MAAKGPLKSCIGNRLGDKLEEFCDACCLQWVRTVLARLLPAEPGPRKDLIGVGDIIRVEAAAHSLHGIEIRLGVHIPHRLLLLSSHPVLSGNRPAMVHAQVKYAYRKVDGNLFLTRN